MTGGGTAGHVTPHFALLPSIRERGWDVFYIGSDGLEQGLVEAQGIPFKSVATGKLRRYASFKNVVDIFKVAWGCLQAFVILRQNRPDVVFSKGGFVAVPVAFAAWLLGIPVVSHESDLTPGLANRLIARVAHKIIYTFAETGKYLPATSEHVGSPVRAELFSGDRSQAISLCGFDQHEEIPTLLVMGGSQGAQRINATLEAILPELLMTMRVVHLTGKGKALAFQHPRYRGFEFVSEELKHLFALGDFVLSRSGANSIFELLALNKPMLLVPLEAGSRGDQVLNARSFAQNSWAMVLRENELTPASLQAALAQLQVVAPEMRQRQASFTGRDAVAKILTVIEAAVRA